MSNISDINFGLLLLALSAIAALATAVFNYLSRPLLVRTIERHSDELKEIAKLWLDEVPAIPPSRQPLTTRPDAIKIPSEDLLLFNDLKEHSPKELKVFETWDRFKEEFNEYNQKRFSICMKVLEQIKSETDIPATSDSRENGIFYPHFVEAVYMDVNDLIRGAEPYYKSHIKEMEPKISGETWEFWVAGNLYAKGTEDLVESAKEYMTTFLDKLSKNNYGKMAEGIIKHEEKLNQLRLEVTKKIKDLIAIPIFPGKCTYIKRAVPGVFERVKNFFSRQLRSIRRL